MESNDLWPALWAKLYDHGASDRKKEGTERYWRTLDSEQQAGVYNSISRKLASGGWVQYDPIRAIKEHTPKKRRQVITADEYYWQYGTQENREGWVRTHIPEEQRTVYVKVG